MKFISVITLSMLGLTVAAQAEETVAYAGYGGAYQEGLRKILFDRLPAEAGMKVIDYSLAGGIRDIRTKVKANAVDIDVAALYGGVCEVAAKEGLLEPLDYDKIPNSAGILPSQKGKHWIGITAYSTVLAYNKNTYGDNPPKNWADFFDVKKFPGTRAIGGNYPSTNMEIALMADGVDKKDIYPLDMERSLKKWQEFKPNISVSWASGAQAAQLATSEEADMLTIWSARIDAAIKDGAPYAYILDDAVMDMDCLVVPKNSPNKEGAMRLINHLIDPKNQAKLPEVMPDGPLNQDAFKLGLISPEAAKHLITSTENIAKQLPLNANYWSEHETEAQTKWDRVMLP